MSNKTTAEALVAASRTRRLARGEQDMLLREGLAWIDKDGRWHLGQPDTDAIAEAFDQHASAPPVHRALQATNEAAREVGRLLGELEAAQAKAAETHHQAIVAAIAEWSRANDAPHAEAHDKRVRDYFDRNPHEPGRWEPIA